METPCPPQFPKISLRIAKILLPCVVAMAVLTLLGLLPFTVSRAVYTFDLFAKTGNPTVTTLAYPSTHSRCLGADSPDDSRTDAERDYAKSLYRETSSPVDYSGDAAEVWRFIVDKAWVVVLGAAFLGLILGTAVRDRCVIIAKSRPLYAEMYPEKPELFSRNSEFRRACCVLSKESGEKFPEKLFNMWKDSTILCYAAFLPALSQILDMYQILPNWFVLILLVCFILFSISCIPFFSRLRRILLSWEKSQKFNAGNPDL